MAPFEVVSQLLYVLVHKLMLVHRDNCRHHDASSHANCHGDSDKTLANRWAESDTQRSD